MELEALKEQINRRLEDPVGDLSPVKTAGAARSHSLLRRLGRNLRVELALYVLCLVLVAWQMWATPQTALRVYDATVILLVLVIMARIRGIIRRVDRHRRSDLPIREHLAELLHILEANSRQYLLFSTGIIPFFLLYGMLLFHFFPIHAPDLPATGSAAAADPPTWVYVTVALVFTALLTGVLYLLTRLYIWWMFGKYIRSLRALLKDQDADGVA